MSGTNSRPPSSEPDMSNTPRHRLLAITAAVALGLAACGADETIDAVAGGVPLEGEPTEQTDDTTPEADPIGEAVTPDPTAEATSGFTPLIPRTDLVQLRPATPDEVIVDPTNDQRLLVRFQGAAEPCSGAAITITETDTEVTVVLEVGLDPNAAAMSCIAQVFDYESVVPLAAPLGDRTITA